MHCSMCVDQSLECAPNFASTVQPNCATGNVASHGACRVRCARSVDSQSTLATGSAACTHSSLLSRALYSRRRYRLPTSCRQRATRGLRGWHGAARGRHVRTSGARPLGQTCQHWLSSVVCSAFASRLNSCGLCAARARLPCQVDQARTCCAAVRTNLALLGRRSSDADGLCHSMCAGAHKQLEGRTQALSIGAITPLQPAGSGLTRRTGPQLQRSRHRPNVGKL